MIAFSHYRPMREGASDALADLARQAALASSRRGAGGASGSID
jgi:hypothetical protein